MKSEYWIFVTTDEWCNRHPYNYNHLHTSIHTARFTVKRCLNTIFIPCTNRDDTRFALLKQWTNQFLPLWCEFLACKQFYGVLSLINNCQHPRHCGSTISTCWVTTIYYCSLGINKQGNWFHTLWMYLNIKTTLAINLSATKMISDHQFTMYGELWESIFIKCHEYKNIIPFRETGITD